MTGPNRPTDTDSTSTVGRLARRLGLGREEYGEGGRDSYYGDDRPIFVLGCCQRTGTSLLQRLITSMPGVFIWGETNGEMGAILRSRQRAVDRSIEVAETRNHIRRAGLLAFMADASPEQQQVDNAYRSYIREMYRYDHTGTPLSRWGYTEFRHDARELAYLLDLFPNAKALVINRDLGQVAESILRYEFDPAIQWSRQWTLDALDMWRENTFEMPALPVEPGVEDQLQQSRAEQRANPQGNRRTPRRTARVDQS